MKVSCPHCLNLFQVADEQGDSLQCPACGSTFRPPESTRHPDEEAGETSESGAASGSSEHGGYHVVRPLAKGGMGQVDVAQDEMLEREVVLKKILAPLADQPIARRRFVEEARITGQLEHPGVVPIYALGVDRQGHPFYAMRHIQGKTLKEAIDQYHAEASPAGLGELLRRFVAICQTMAYAHNRGVIHRDLKPANVMLGEFGETLVLDWGLAKPIVETGTDATQGDLAENHRDGRADMTRPGTRVGSPPYMAPEQAEGDADAATVAADVYGLGAILYQLLTGKPPYLGETSEEIIEKVLAGPPEKPSTLPGDIPPAVEAICLKAMARDSSERYADTTALAGDLQNWLDDEPVSVYPEPLLQRTWRWCRHHRAATIGSIVFVLVSAAAIAIGTVMVEKQRIETAAAEKLAEENARQLARAEAKLAEKEKEVERKTRESDEHRQQAVQAIELALQAQTDAQSAKTKATELDAALETATGDKTQMQAEFDEAQAALADAESRGQAQQQKAREASARAEALDTEVAELRKEIEQLRTLVAGLARLVAGEPIELSPSVPEAAQWADFSEEPVADFDATTSNEMFCLLSRDTARKNTGTASLRLDTLSQADARVSFPANRGADWDVSDQTFIKLDMFVDDSKASTLQDLTIRIGRGSSYIEYRADEVNEFRGDWLRSMIPLFGNNKWTRSEVNHPDLAHIDWIEVHVRSADGPLTVWLDNFSFVKQPSHAIAPFDAKQAEQYQQAWADHLGVPVEITNSVGMKLRLIPPGEFDFGSTEEEIEQAITEGKQSDTLRIEHDVHFEHMLNEGPRQRLLVAGPYYAGQHEVTFGQFRTFVEATGYVTDAEKRGANGWQGEKRIEAGDEHPVMAVTWNDAMAFCRWLSEEEGRNYRLPTEVEWEYACRAGTTTSWHSGDDVATLQHVANTRDASYLRAHPKAEWAVTWDDGYDSTAPVGQFLPNAFGLYDMHGNVSERCLGPYCPNLHNSLVYDNILYPNNVGSERTPALAFPGSRPSRGSTLRHSPIVSRSASRDEHHQDWCFGEWGLRVVYIPPTMTCEAMYRVPPPLKMEEAKEVASQSGSVPLPLAVAPFAEAEAKQHQQAWADYLGVPVEQEVDLSGGEKLAIVLIPPGEFMMGTSDDDHSRFLKEAQAIDEGFIIRYIASENSRARGKDHEAVRPFPQ